MLNMLDALVDKSMAKVVRPLSEETTTLLQFLQGKAQEFSDFKSSVDKTKNKFLNVVWTIVYGMTAYGLYHTINVNSISNFVIASCVGYFAATLTKASINQALHPMIKWGYDTYRFEYNKIPFSFANNSRFLFDIKQNMSLYTELPNGLQKFIKFLEMCDLKNSIHKLIKFGAKISDFGEKYWKHYLSIYFENGVVVGQVFRLNKFKDPLSSYFDQSDPFEMQARNAFLKGWETQSKVRRNCLPDVEPEQKPTRALSSVSHSLSSTM